MRHKALQAIGALWVLQGAPLQLPAPRGYVNDFASVIDASSAARIERVIDDVRAKSGGEIVVVTLADIGDRAASDVALDIGRRWKVGRKGAPGDAARNTGVVILVVPKESSSDGRGHIAISTGTGAEGFITDGSAGAIRDEAIPQLKQRDYGGAILLITTRVAQRYAWEFRFALDSATAIPAPPEPERSRGTGLPPERLLLIAFIIFILIIQLIARRGRRRGCGGGPVIFVGGGGHSGGWSSGGGGGFGGFGGGGGFGGRGASGSW